MVVLACLVLPGCWGLDGVRGQLIEIHDDGTYVVNDIRGYEKRMRVDAQTHKDDVKVGDRVQAFVGKDGRAQFLERLD
jgi:hypothetical protein